MPSSASKKRLTVKSLDALKPAPPGKRYTVYDAEVPGFGVRVSPEGKRTFIMYRRLGQGGPPVRHTIGAYVPGATEGEIGSLGYARDEARRALTALASGR